jgi:hypothetical protein
VLSWFAFAALWLWFDWKSMTTIEHHDTAGWYLLALPGAYVAAILSIIAVVIIKACRFVRRPRAMSESHQLNIAS